MKETDGKRRSATAGSCPWFLLFLFISITKHMRRVHWILFNALKASMAFTASVNDEWEREKILAAVFHSLSFPSLFFLAASTPSINFFSPLCSVYCCWTLADWLGF